MYVYVCICTHIYIHICTSLFPSIVKTVVGITNDIQLVGFSIGSGVTSDTCMYMLYTHIYTYMYITVPEYCEDCGGYYK